VYPLVILPLLMLFHYIWLMGCAGLAQLHINVLNGAAKLRSEEEE